MSPKPKVLILTPIKDAVDEAESYLRGLQSLQYPHDLLSLGMLESDSRDQTAAKYEAVAERLRESFASAQLWRKDFGYRLPPGKERWDPGSQEQRRHTLAKSRNHLLSRALQDQDWVLWIDADVIEYPPDLIERLLAVEQDIVHPHCVKEFGGPSFDHNAWRDHGRLRLDDLRDEGEQVELHAVGGTVLLIRADVHREGLVFPTFFFGRPSARARRDNRCRPRLALWGALRGDYQGEIETEGLGIMAHEMGYRCVGLPHLEVRHRDA